MEILNAFKIERFKIEGATSYDNRDNFQEFQNAFFQSFIIVCVANEKIL